MADRLTERASKSWRVVDQAAWASISDEPGSEPEPSTSWLRAIDTDAHSVNIGIHSACRKASDSTLWRRIVDTATLRHD